MSTSAFQPYQRAILAFLARAKDEDDKIILWNGRLRWKSEFVVLKPLETGPIRGARANVLIFDEFPAFPIDSIS